MPQRVLRRVLLAGPGLGTGARLGVGLVWRAAGDRSSRLALRYHFAGLDVAELDILSFVDRLTNDGAEGRAMTVNFAERVVPPCFGARQHAVEVARSYRVCYSKVFAVMSSTDNCALWSAASTSFSSALIAGHPHFTEFFA